MFTPDGDQVIAGNHWNQGARAFDLATWEGVQWDMDPGGSVWTVRFSPDGQQFATASSAKKGRIWDTVSKREVGVLPHDDVVRTVTYSDDGAWIATGSFDQTARIWSTVNGEPLCEPLSHPSIVDDVDLGELEGRVVLATAHWR